MKKTVVQHAALGGMYLVGYTPYKALSRETTAFSATVHDAKTDAPIGVLTNDGWGGCNMFRAHSIEGHKRWEEASRDFEPVPYSWEEEGFQGEWGLDDALVTLSEVALSLMEQGAKGEVQFCTTDPRTIAGASSLPILTVGRKPKAKTVDGMRPLLDECLSEHATLVFGVPNTGDNGGINVFVAEASDGERSSSRAGGKSGVR